jgi:hypothetical protein
VLTQHRDPDVRAVRQGADRGERAGQVQRDVLPVAPEVDRYLDAVQQRDEAPFVPPVVADRVLDGDGPPQVAPRVRVVMQLEEQQQAGHGGIAVGRGELAVHVRLAEQLTDPPTSRLRQSLLVCPEVIPIIARNVGDERGAHQPVGRRGGVQVDGRFKGEDGSSRSQARTGCGNRARWSAGR